MPLPPSVSAALQRAPRLDRDPTPPTLTADSQSPAGSLSYERFEFDPEADELGTGGNATVYRATVSGDGTTVALKRPFPDRTIPKATVERILDESENWARVDDHPYVATVFDWGLDEVPWIAIEHLSGGTLEERGEAFDFTQRLWTAYAIVDAVAYAAGQCGVTHHDLKPGNVLFQRMPDGTWDVPKVVDWGLSRELIQHTGSISQATPDYAAPEQFDALMPDVPVGPHTDVYQLGVVCYELLTGDHPNHLGGEVTPPSRVASEVPAAADEVVLQALSHDRGERYEHPVLFKKALSDLLRDRADGTEDRGSRTGDATHPPAADGTDEATGNPLDRDTTAGKRRDQGPSNSHEDDGGSDAQRDRAIRRLVKSKFDEYPRCEQCSDPFSLTDVHHNPNDDWECAGPSDRTKRLTKNGFDVADDFESPHGIYIRKSGEHYIGLEGATTVVGTGPHETEINRILRYTSPDSWDQYRVVAEDTGDSLAINRVRK